MKEIVLYEDEDCRHIARIWHKNLIVLVKYYVSDMELIETDSFKITSHSIIKIYHEIKEEG